MKKNSIKNSQFNSVKYKKTSKFKYIIVAMFCLLALFSTFKLDFYASSDSGADEINLGVSQVVGTIDFDEMQTMVDGLEDFGIFSSSIKDKVSKIISGSYFTDYSSIGSAIFSMIFVDIREFLPLLFTLIALGLLSNILYSIKSDSSASTGEIIHFVCFSVMVMIVLIAFKDIMVSVNVVLGLIVKQMQLVFPILITLLASIGSL